MNSVISWARGGLALSSQRRGVIPLVLLLNFSGHNSAKSRSTSFFRSSVCSLATPFTEQEPTVARCAMRMYFSPSFVDDAHPTQAVVIQRPARGDIAHEPGVDFVDDLQVARQQLSEHFDRPLLQRFRQNGMIGVAGGRRSDLPSLIPPQPLAVNQQAHQLRNRPARDACH